MPDLFFSKVSRLRGGSGNRAAEKSPYVLSQMLAPFEMLLGGVLLGLLSLWAEIRRGKKVIVRGSAVVKRSRSSPKPTSARGAALDLTRYKIRKTVRFGFDSMIEEIEM